MFNKLVKKSWFPLIIRIISAIGFIFALIVLYIGSVKIIFGFNSSLMMFVLWVFWWPLLYVSLIFLGRLWCGFICPVGLANEVGNSLSKKRKTKFYRYGFIPFVVFFLIVFWEQISGLFSSTQVTIFFLVSFVSAGFLLGLILPGWGFCKMFCPIGTLFGSFSRLSFLGVRTDKVKCEKCKTKECVVGGEYPKCPTFINVPKIKSNKDCVMCGYCIKNCPYDSAKICKIKAGEELREKAGFSLRESFFIIALLGMSVLLTTRGTLLLRFFDASGSLLRAIDFVLWIGIFLGLFLFINLFVKGSYRENLRNSGFVYLPLVFSLFFFLIVFGFLTPLTSIGDTMIAVSKYIILGIGVIWSSKLSYDLFDKRFLVYFISIIAIAGFWVLVLIPGPLSLFSYSGNVYVVEEGGVVQMDAYSMGFNPSIIKVKKGYFDINITNVDVIHSFDIDEMDVHVNLEGGGSRRIRINALEEGEYEFYCKIPGHKEAGMKGVLIVEDV
ncbi:MAG: cupredoxin domain-containing protein [Nanoarchaeota archaeon]|nr:cupredoxin domain-containing protein [Nanoarchaeota archaeon]